ncbi:hypothetical protein M422DRAFT_28923, partial [Sphaerobolus stellatus SS14]
MTSDDPPVLPPLSLDVSNDIVDDIIPKSFSNDQELNNEQAGGAQDATPSSPNATLSSPTEGSQAKLLPVPASDNGTHSTASFMLPEAGSSGTTGGEMDQLHPEIASADIAISADGTFVQTSSAKAALELKKTYDKMLGVGQEGENGVVIRSPYAITNVLNDDGTKFFRVGIREQTPSSPEDGALPETPHLGHATGSRRKARLSVQGLLPASMFKPSSVTTEGNNGVGAGSGSISRSSAVSTALASGSNNSASLSSATSPQSRRKLRKSRSNSDLVLRMVANPPNAGTDATGHLSPPPRVESFMLEIRDELTAGADPFSQVLGWAEELASDPVPSSRKGAKASAPPTPAEGEEEPTDSYMPRRPSVSTSAALSSNADMPHSPFGDNVRYAAPLRRDAILPDSQPQLREMQSFESGLTARIGDDRLRSPKLKKPQAATIQNHARFSTKVFEVLQTYRGLPLPSLLLAAPPTGATIKLSANDSANPKDDPRFVIWGEIQPEGAVIDDSSASSHTDLSNAAGSSVPPRKRSNARPPESPSANSQDNAVQTVIIAATVERWISQLTSELNYEELLNFLLTYRSYISPVDLCHLLICRFHWALETPTSTQDEVVRRIIRVRTFIAIKYWISTFFREDFLPNPELCHLFASWLNNLSKEPHMKDFPDALSIIKKLKRLVRECKTTHTRNTRPAVTSNSNSNGNSNGKEKEKSPIEESDDSDVDLDFSATGYTAAHYEILSGQGTTVGTPIHLGNAGSVSSSHALSSPKDRASGASSANSILLSQPLSKAILGHLKSNKPGIDISGPAALPIQHSAISRAFVNTMGRLGRWRRVLNARSSVVPAPACADMSAFDLEPNGTGDLLTVKGGMEEYLKMLNVTQPSLSVGPTQPHAQAQLPQEPAEHQPAQESESQQELLAAEVALQTDGEHVASTDKTPDDVSSVNDSLLYAPSRPPGLEDLPEQIPSLPKDDTTAEGASSFTRESSDPRGSFFTTTETTEASEALASESPSQPDWTPEIVSLDDYDLSDSETSSVRSPTQRKLPRRLPLRRDFQFVHSVHSVSSLGIRSRSSLASSVKSGSIKSRTSLLSERQSGVTLEGGRQLAAIPLESWHLDLISDDEDEAGDAEAALRRLEGQIDMERQREKEAKIGRWLQSARRNARDFTHERGRESISSIRSDSQLSEADEDRADEERLKQEQPDEDITVSVRNSTSIAPISPAEETPSTATHAGYGSSSVVVNDRDRSASVSSSQGPIVTSRPTSGDMRRPSLIATAPRAPLTSQFGSPNIPSAHRSFIFLYKTETLAQQFTIIEAELFTKIRFEELVSHQWGQSMEDVDVRDWVLFVKERAKLKNTGKSITDPSVAAKLSAILALRARFDLMVNFIASEVLLTPAADRIKLVEKLIRLAWKLYLHNNFGTLVALMSGLQTRWVNQVIARQWHKIAVWEQRIFEDLRWFTSRIGQFKFIQKATTAIIEARPLQTPGLESSSSVSGPTASASSKSKPHDTRRFCVPFLG